MFGRGFFLIDDPKSFFSRLLELECEMAFFLVSLGVSSESDDRFMARLVLLPESEEVKHWRW